MGIKYYKCTFLRRTTQRRKGKKRKSRFSYKQEHEDPFADVSAKSILDDYQNLKPWVKEGLVHRVGQPDEPKRIGARSLEVRYRMHDELYPEVDEMGHHDIDEEGIAKSLLPYIKSLKQIYSKIYSNNK